MSDPNNTYTELYDKVCETLKKYSMAGMAQGIEIHHIHDMVHKHKDKLLAITTFQQGKDYAGEIAYSMLGFPCPISYVITDEADLVVLYDVCIAWRDSVLLVKEMPKIVCITIKEIPKV